MDEGCSCLAIVAVAFLFGLWVISDLIGRALSIDAFWIFITLIILLIGLYKLLDAYLRKNEKKREARFEYIKRMYPHAYAQYAAKNGHADNQKIPENFKKDVVKRHDLVWEREEYLLKTERDRQRRIKEEEKKKLLAQELQQIESQFPNGTRLLKERFPLYDVEYLVRNKTLISNLEDEYKVEEKRKREEEEKKKEENRIRLAPDAPKVLLSKGQSWERLFGSFHYTWLFYYYPTTCDFEATEEEWTHRRLVWNFKNDPERIIMPAIHERAIDLVIPQIKQKLNDTFGEEYLQFLTLVCLPASTKVKNIARYDKFSVRLCEETGMENGYAHTHVVKDGMSKNHPDNNTGHSIQPVIEFDKGFFKGKLVLLFDDVVTKGETMLKYKSEIEKIGATVIGGICIGKTKHERPVQQRIVNFDEDIPLF